MSKEIADQLNKMADMNDAVGAVYEKFGDEINSQYHYGKANGLRNAKKIIYEHQVFLDTPA